MTDWQHPTTDPEPEGDTYRILIVDDDPEVLRSLAFTVRRAVKLPVEVFPEADPRRGLKRLHEDTYHMVVADYRMPGMTGVELLREAAKLQPACLRVLITGYREEDIAHDAVENGRVHGYLLKPWSVQFMGDHLRDLLTAAVPQELELHEAIRIIENAQGVV